MNSEPIIQVEYPSIFKSVRDFWMSSSFLFFIIPVWTIYKKVYLSIDKKEDMLMFQQAEQHNDTFCPNNRRFWLWEQLTGSWRTRYSMANDSEGVFVTHELPVSSSKSKCLLWTSETVCCNRIAIEDVIFLSKIFTPNYSHMQSMTKALLQTRSSVLIYQPW